MLRTLVSISSVIPDPLNPRGELGIPHPQRGCVLLPAHGLWQRRRHSLKEFCLASKLLLQKKLFCCSPRLFVSFHLSFPLQR